jgi:hypothetical protein
VAGKERKGPVGVGATEERVCIPALEMECDRIRDCSIGVHGLEDFHNFLLNIQILHALDAK